MTDVLEEREFHVSEDADILLAEVERGLQGGSLRGECRPAVDVIETAQAVEIVADLPGVSPGHVRVAFRRNLLIIVGVKRATPSGERPLRVHLAERAYGRFLRVVRLNAAIDAAQAQAHVRHGLLRVVAPRLTERRGQLLRVPVERPA